MHTTQKIEVLATRKATIQLEIKKLQDSMAAIDAELIHEIPAGKAFTTHEFRITHQPGKQYFAFICNDDEKHRLQKALVDKGVADFKVSKGYLDLRFIKDGSNDDE